MANYDVIPLSESVDGRNIKVAQTATPGTLIHTAVTGTGNIDEPEILATNTGDDEVTLTIEWGGTTNPDDRIIMKIPSKASDFRISTGRVIRKGLEIRIFASAANVINVGGKVRCQTV